MRRGIIGMFLTCLALVSLASVLVVVFMVFDGRPSDDGVSIPKQAAVEIPASGSRQPPVPVAGSPVPASTPPAGESVPLTRDIPPCTSSRSAPALCEPYDMSEVNLFPSRLGGASYAPDETSSVEDVLEKGLRLAGASPVHIAFRGTAATDSVRCEWRGIARTPGQRERTIRFWLELDDDEPLPSAVEVERQFMEEIDAINAVFPETAKSGFRIIAQGGLSTDQAFLTCYADYTVSEYLLGTGPSSIEVAYDHIGETRSYDLYKRAHAAGEFGDDLLMTEAEYETALNQTVWTAELSLADIVEGREGVVFLAPMGAHGAIAVEAWQTVAQWDVQEADDGTVNAVRYGAHASDPEHTQTLSALKARIAAAVGSPGSGGSEGAGICGVISDA